MADLGDLQTRDAQDVLGDVQDALIEIRELLTAAKAICVQSYTAGPKVTPATASLYFNSIERVLGLADAAADRAWKATDCRLAQE